MVTYPDRSAVTFAYDADNRLSDVTDWRNRSTSYRYDAASNLTGVTYPNRVTSAMTYDAANRLTGITDSANLVAYRVLVYALDNVGNRTAVTDGGATTNYTYDAVNELLTAHSSAGETSWTYDAVGNRTEQVAPSGTTTYTYDADNRMLTAGSTTFTYDHNGNRLTETASSSKTTYTYDANNRLLTVTGPNGTSTFRYDGDGNRIAQTTPTGTYSYVNDTAIGLPVVLHESGPDGNIDYAYSLGLLESLSSAFNYFYNLDGLGSVSNLTDATGKVQETYSYDAWGNALSAMGNVGTKNKFRFTGQALDPGTGLYYLRARYYDPTLGRFLSRDPFSGPGRQPITLNRYAYSANNPAKFVDPSGFIMVPVSPPVPEWTNCWYGPCINPNWLTSMETAEEEQQQEIAKALEENNFGCGPAEPSWFELGMDAINLFNAISSYPNYTFRSTPPVPPLPLPPLQSLSAPTSGPTPAPLPPPQGLSPPSTNTSAPTVAGGGCQFPHEGGPPQK